MRQHMVRLRPARLDEHVPDPLVEREVGPALAVQVTELAAAEPERKSAEAVRVRRDALPRPDLALDPGGDSLHPCRSTSASASCPGSATSWRVTTGRFSPKR